MDKTSSINLSTLHPRVRTAANKAWEEAQGAMPDNVVIVVIAGLRTFEKSDELYKIGRTIKGENATSELPMGEIVTKAKAGQSYHNYGLAFDFAMTTNGRPDYIVGPNWMKVVAIMRSYGFSWGGDFPDGFHDNAHFENRLGYSWRRLLELYNAKKFIEGTNYLDL